MPGIATPQEDVLDDVNSTISTHILHGPVGFGAKWMGITARY
jgi:hypothetical protein